MKSELRQQQYTVTLSDCNHLARNSYLANTKIYMLLSVSLYLRAISMQAQSRGAYIRAGVIKRRVFLRYEFEPGA